MSDPKSESSKPTRRPDGGDVSDAARSRRSDPVAGIRRIYDSEHGIGLMIMPPLSLFGAAIRLQFVCLYLKRADNGCPSKIHIFELGCN